MLICIAAAHHPPTVVCLISKSEKNAELTDRHQSAEKMRIAKLPSWI